MTKDEGDSTSTRTDDGPARGDERPLYEPPRVVKKRSLSRATLFTGEGPAAAGPAAVGPGLVAEG